MAHQVIPQNPQKKLAKEIFKRSKSPRLIVFGLAIGLVVAGSVLWQFSSNQNVQRTDFVSGRIEGYETNLGAKIGGRVEYIAVREGDRVSKGQLLIRISEQEVVSQLSAANSRILRAKDVVREAGYQQKVISNQIQESSLRLTQSTEDVVAQEAQAVANESRAKAVLEEMKALLCHAKSEVELAKLRAERWKVLAREGAASTDEYQSMQTAYETSSATVLARKSSLEAAGKEYDRAAAALRQIRSLRLEPKIRQTQRAALENQLIQAQLRSRIAEHEAAAASAERDEIQAKINYLNISSPINGTVTARPVEPGCVVVPGQTILSLIDLEKVYLRAYIPEGRIGCVRVGQKANVHLDSYPNKFFTGSVIEIDPEGSFTPENIYFKKDRVRQVFGIRIAIDSPAGFAKPGMPADAEIFTDQSSEHYEP